MSVAIVWAIVVTACDEPLRATAYSDPLEGGQPEPSPSQASDDEPMLVEALRHCDGSLLPACTNGRTGPSCTLPCAAASPSPGGPPPPECGFELYCHGDGSVYGLAALNAFLYEGAPEG